MYTSQGAGLGGASTHFLQSFKTLLSRNLDRNMLQNVYFLEIIKIVTSSGDPRTPALLLPLTITNCRVHFYSAKCVYLLSKKEQNNYSKCSAFAFFRTFPLTFHFKFCNFCWRGRKNFSCSRPQVPSLPTEHKHSIFTAQYKFKQSKTFFPETQVINTLTRINNGKKNRIIGG